MDDKGVLIASLSTVFIAFSIVVASVATKIVHPFVLALLAYILSIVFLFVLAKAVGEKFQFRQLLRDFRRPLAEVVIFRCVLGQLILLVGFSLTIAMRAIFMLRFEPVFVLIYSAILLRERVTARKIILIIILLLGGFLFITDLSTDIAQNVMLGDLLVILALVFLAYSYLPSAKISKKINPTTLTITSNIIAAIIIAPIIGLVLPITLMVPDMTGLTYILVYAILFYVFGVFLWFKALASVKPWVVASVLALEPIAGALLAFFWLGQWITAVQIVGAAIMIAATYLIAKYK
ncbi:MAG: DMT family transporter [Candidatus Aenigmarchaeota archaeon]